MRPIVVIVAMLALALTGYAQLAHASAGEPNTMVELLPCPHCGGPASIVRLQHADSMFSVRCDRHCDVVQSSEKEAAAAWNRRAPAPAAPVERWAVLAWKWDSEFGGYKAPNIASLHETQDEAREAAHRLVGDGQVVSVQTVMMR